MVTRKVWKEAKGMYGGLGCSSGNVEVVGGLSVGEIGKELDEGCGGVGEKKMGALAF